MNPFLHHLSKRRLARRRNVPGAGIPDRPGAICRHARWTQQVIAAFARHHRHLAGQHVEKIVAMAARPWIFVFHNYLSHARPAGEGRAPSRGPLETGPLAPVRSSSVWQVHRELALEAPTPRPVARPLLVRELGAARRSGLLAGPVRQEMAFVRPRAARRASTGAAPAASIFAPRPPRVLTVVQPDFPQSGAEAGSDAGRVIRRHARTEDLHVAASRAASPILALAPQSEIAATVEQRPLRSFKPQLSESESAPRVPAAIPEIPFNITRVTDEILKQLDRRIVAARERMGRM